MVNALTFEDPREMASLTMSRDDDDFVRYVSVFLNQKKKKLF